MKILLIGIFILVIGINCTSYVEKEPVVKESSSRVVIKIDSTSNGNVIEVVQNGDSTIVSNNGKVYIIQGRKYTTTTDNEVRLHEEPLTIEQYDSLFGKYYKGGIRVDSIK